MRLLSVLTLSLAAAATAAMAAPPAPPAPNHPILGIWMLTLPDGSCSEIYRFRGEGTTLVTSAGEVLESEFTIPAKPSAKGYYRLDDKVIKDNGKADCIGAVTKPGVKMTHFVLFHPSGALFVLCADESANACIGPFRRLEGKET